MDTNATLLYKSLQVVSYADVVNILARKQLGAKEALTHIEEEEVGLLIDEILILDYQLIKTTMKIMT